MSESIVRGKIKNFSPKPDENYYGVCIDEGSKGENWYNGQGDIPDNLEKSQKVKLKIFKDRFCEIDEINVMEKHDTQNQASQESPDDVYVPPELQVALKKAVDAADVEPNDGIGDHTNQVRRLTEEYYRILKNVGGGE